MKFYGVGAVWDKDNEKVLCVFTNGELDTDDNDIISKLVALGYRHDRDVIEVTTMSDATEKVIQGVTDLNIKTDEEIKALAKKAKIKGYGLMTREKLIQLLQEA
jgi:hypothetical protein